MPPKPTAWIVFICLIGQAVVADVFQDLAFYTYGSPTNTAEAADQLLKEAPPDQYAAIEDSLIAVIAAGDATEDGKACACRLLQQVGSKDCVPALAGLLVHDVLSHYARLVLESMTDSEEAGAALRAALKDAPDKLKVGILASIAERGDEAALEIVIEMASHKNEAVAGAAIRALGVLGGRPAADALQKAKPPETLNKTRLDALLACAASLDNQAAAEIYGYVYGQNIAICRAGAVRGMIRVDEDKAAEWILAHLRDENGPLRRGVLLFAATDGTSTLTAELCKALPALDPAGQADVLTALGARGDVTALPHVLAALDSTETSVQLAAVKTAGKLGDRTTVKALLAKAETGDEAVAERAVEALAGLHGEGVDEVLGALLLEEDSSPRVIEIVSRRGSGSAGPMLVRLTSDENKAIRTQAWIALSKLGNADDLDAAFPAALAVKDDAERAEAERTLKLLCSRAEDKEKCIAVASEYYAEGSPATRLMIIDLASIAGGPRGLKIARQALESGDAEIRSAAIRVLAEWRGSEAAPVLLEAARASVDKDQLIALRGYLQLVGEAQENKRLAMYRAASELVTRPDEKRLMISGLRFCRSVEALGTLEAFLADDAVRAEAETACVDLAEDLLGNDKAHAKIHSLAARLSDISQNKQVLSKAGQLLEKTGPR